MHRTRRLVAGLLVVLSMAAPSVAFADEGGGESQGETAARQWSNTSPATLPNLIAPSIAYDETNMWDISDSATYSGTTFYISVTGSSPASLPRRVTFDGVNKRLVLQ